MKRLLLVCLISAVPLVLSAQTDFGNPFSQTKFVPDIALILDFAFLNRDNGLADLEIPGLIPSGSAEKENDTHGGFNLNYAELAIGSVVDPYFNLLGIFSIEDKEIQIEEAYFTTRRMPFGLQVKAGKLFSAFSRINEQHDHCWDFTDRPLIQRAFFGSGGLNEKGVQITWVAPVSLYWMVGAEILSGENGSSFGNSGFRDVSQTLTVQDKETPNLAVGFMRTSFDLGDLVVLGGVSAAFGGTRLNRGIDVSGAAGQAEKADARLLGGGVTLKYLFDSNHYLNVQSEYIHRKTDGTLYEKDALDLTQASPFLKKQAGWYVQAVAKYGMRSRAGIRYERIDTNGLWKNSIKETLPEGLSRLSAMIEFNPTEFSRIRFQYNRDQSLFLEEESGFVAKTVNEWMIQCNLSIGAHGAHPF